VHAAHHARPSETCSSRRRTGRRACATSELARRTYSCAGSARHEQRTDSAGTQLHDFEPRPAWLTTRTLDHDVTQTRAMTPFFGVTDHAKPTTDQWLDCCGDGD